MDYRDVELDFEIDKLTNSIENVLTGDRFQTQISVLTKTDMTKISQDGGWTFNWKEEFATPQREVFKLTILHNINVVQGLISIQIKSDHIYMHLLESAPFNKGKSKVYSGVAGNLVAFACKRSFQLGFEGYISFLSKSSLIHHYEKKLMAEHIGGRIMIINSQLAMKLIDRYFKDEL